MTPRQILAPKHQQLSGEGKSKTPPFNEWEPFGEVVPGHFYVEDLTQVRENLFYRGYIPRVNMGHKGDIHKLTVALPEGKCVVHRTDPETSKSIAALLEAFGIEYTGQSLPAATQTVLFELLKPKREHL